MLLMQKLGQARVSSDPSKNWDVQIRRRLSSSGPETLQSMMGSEARAQRASELSAAERPFAAGQEAKAWLDEASIPLEGSGASLSSLFEIPEGYSPSQIGVIGDKKFDDAAEEQTEQYQAVISSNVGALPRPFAAGGDAKSWLDEASILLQSSGPSSDISKLYEGYDPSQAELVGDQSFDSMAEDQTRNYLDGLSSTPSASQKPFAADNIVPGWLESASSPMVRLVEFKEFSPPPFLMQNMDILLSSFLILQWKSQVCGRSAEAILPQVETLHCFSIFEAIFRSLFPYIAHLSSSVKCNKSVRQSMRLVSRASIPSSRESSFLLISALLYSGLVHSLLKTWRVKTHALLSHSSFITFA